MTMSPKSFSIKNWSQDDQPREKLRDKGPLFKRFRIDCYINWLWISPRKCRGFIQTDFSECGS